MQTWNKTKKKPFELVGYFGRKRVVFMKCKSVRRQRAFREAREAYPHYSRATVRFMLERERDEAA